MACMDDAVLLPAVAEAHEGEKNKLPAKDIACKIIEGIKEGNFRTLGCPLTGMPYTLTGPCRWAIQFAHRSWLCVVLVSWCLSCSTRFSLELLGAQLGYLQI
jgi:hypothetical protein